ncbi:MAG: FAD-dependent oxidoreductase [Candidatus Nephthysia bennettiae]|uniref:NAD(P)-binding domain-containing protein n=1 Tax=Candidatus Nephthysia bennettiae TaxID=3127016 RepID=A0A934N4Q4_9BACT|nr:NAD(P)-binding domain-containing protein [Candidatus Dormibacteraeota bacterium]PZR85896.1 MAG: FAD-dependent oxidoreductase [Candidatus Dormibacteraeota bacterium]
MKLHTLVIGAGQAGLATSWHLGQRGIEHVVLERGRVAETWRTHRWDSFRLLIPNALCQLPGFGYSGEDPTGFMWKGDVVRFFEDYAGSFDPPVREGVAVTELRRGLDGDWEILTASDGVLSAKNVVVATGAHQRPHVPAVAGRLDPRIAQFHTDGYSNPSRLPEGGVLVVGGGSSGGQVAAELAMAGRDVYMALGRCAWLMRRYRGRDITDWNKATGFTAQPVESLEDPAARLGCLPMLAASDTGKDLNPRVLREMGVTLAGRLTGADGTMVRFADDLAATIAAGDGFMSFLKARIDAFIAVNGIEAPEDRSTPYAFETGASLGELDLEAQGVTSIVWATGYRMDFSWILDAEFDGQGYPVHQGGVAPAAGLYFMGLPWLNTRGSGFIVGVGADAERIVADIDARGGRSQGQTVAVAAQ